MPHIVGESIRISDNIGAVLQIADQMQTAEAIAHLATMEQFIDRGIKRRTYNRAFDRNLEKINHILSLADSDNPGYFMVVNGSLASAAEFAEPYIDPTPCTHLSNRLSVGSFTTRIGVSSVGIERRGVMVSPLLFAGAQIDARGANRALDELNSGQRSVAVLAGPIAINAFVKRPPNIDVPKIMNEARMPFHLKVAS